MTYAELCQRLHDSNARFGLRLIVELGNGLDDETRSAIKEHKPLIVARVANAMQRTELDTWEWGSQPGNGSPPF